MYDIHFPCPHCLSPLVVEARGAGWDVPCPKCGQEIKIPQHSAPERADTKARGLLSLVRTFPIFHGINERAVGRMLTYFKPASCDRGDDILRLGEPAKSFFIVLEGTVVILGEKDVVLSSLGPGGVFGEMSLLSGEPVGATVRAAEPVRMLYTEAQEFHALLESFPTLSLFFSGLLAGRLAQKNMERAHDLASGISGQLSELRPADLIQTIHQSHKTGVLCLHLPGGEAKLHFEYGQLLAAYYGDQQGRDAVFALLGQSEGRFNFTVGLDTVPEKGDDLGDVSWLLMEGMRRLDERGA